MTDYSPMRLRFIAIGIAAGIVAAAMFYWRLLDNSAFIESRKENEAQTRTEDLRFGARPVAPMHVSGKPVKASAQSAIQENEDATTGARAATHPFPKSDIRRMIEASLFSGCREDAANFARLARQRSSEVTQELLAMLETESEENPFRLRGILLAISGMARRGFVYGTHPRILALVRGTNDKSVRLAALEAASLIADAKAIDLFVDILREGPGAEVEEAIYFKAIDLAPRTGDARVAAELVKPAREGSQTAIRAIAHLGIGADWAVLTNLAANARREEVRIDARQALEAVSIMMAPDREGRLLEALKRPGTPWGWLSWPDWALDKIERLRLFSLAGSLREFYDTFEERPNPEPQSEDYRRYLSRLRLKVLRTIRRLGGRIAADEAALLNEAMLSD